MKLSGGTETCFGKLIAMICLGLVFHKSKMAAQQGEWPDRMAEILDADMRNMQDIDIYPHVLCHGHALSLGHRTC